MTSSTPIFRFQRGNHICVFYRDDSTLLEFLIPYVCKGLRNNERCFLVQQASLIRRLTAALWRAGVQLEREVKRGAIEIHQIEEVYLKNGSFDADAMIHQLEEGIAAAVENGFNGVRTAGDLGWAASMRIPHEILVRYEQMVEEIFPQRPAVGVCQYPMSIFEERDLRDILRTHRTSIQQPQSDSCHTCMAIHERAYTLEIVADRQKPDSKVDFVVQSTGTQSILGWGSEPNVERAIHMGQQLVGF